MTSRRRAEPVDRSAGVVTHAVDVVVLVGALALSLAPLVPVFGAASVLPAIGGGLALGAVVAAVGSVRRWSGQSVVAVLVLVYFAVGGALAAPETTTRGWLPTGRTFLSLAAGSVTSWKQVLTLEPPLGAAGNLLVAPFLLALVGSAASLSVVWRARRPAVRSLGALFPPACLLVAILLGTKTTVLPLAAGLTDSAVLVLWAAWRTGTVQPRRVASLLLVLAISVAGGVVGGPAVSDSSPRYVLRDEIAPPFDPQGYRSPLAAFRRYVKEDKDVALFTMTGLPKGAIVRLATMDAFDGVVWNVSGGRAAEGSGEFRRVGQTITESVRGDHVRVGVQVGAIAGVWLPTVGNATAVVFGGQDATTMTGRLRYNDATGAAVVTGGLHDGVSYTLDAIVPSVPDDTTVGSATPADVTLPPAVGVPDVVGTRAAEIARTAGSPVLIARSLQQALFKGGFFSHGQTQSGEFPSLSGHGADRIGALLGGSLMVGDGEQYASAMALMARAMGLPARVVLGFVPTAQQDGAKEITFTGAQVQAWVEIAFTGYGCVPFYPTPPESQTPQQDTQAQKPEPDPQVFQPPPPPEEPATAPNDDTEQPQTDAAQRTGHGSSLWRTVAVVAGAAGIPLVLFGVPVLLVLGAKRRRRRRRFGHRDPVARIAGGWDEVLDTARDHRRPPPERATRREIALVLGPALSGGRDPAASWHAGPGRDSWLALADRADEAVFGQERPSDDVVAAYWAEVERAVAGMGDGIPRRHRLRARLSLASLRRRG